MNLSLSTFWGVEPSQRVRLSTCIAALTGERCRRSGADAHVGGLYSTSDGRVIGMWRYGVTVLYTFIHILALSGSISTTYVKDMSITLTCFLLACAVSRASVRSKLDSTALDE